MSYEAIRYEPANGVGRITIDREARRNALNPQVIAELADALQAAERDRGVRVIVLRGSGDRAFSAGGDLGGISGDGPVAQHFARSTIAELFRDMRRSRLPIIAAVNGHALAGGFGLMLACDLVVAADDVELGTPEVNLGLWPFMITTVIQRDLPRKLALELMLTGRRMRPEEARAAGFVNRVVARDRLDDAVDELAGELLAKSSLVLELGKRSFYRAESMAFDDALDYLAGMLTVCLQSEDAAEGISAFVQKREPQWKGR